ncbi:MAG: hypothetical protein ACD_2C00183G0002 [uncultured bacterium (gcode 4)]|uniref:Bacterial type II secretion system protein E domain-containing protein n=1 Tax=uncultured bacterium (gcode 4) TaxID=1234023 RepID=K2G2D9_9BACT|nr:MAG: hypothetical protein ACD_2C00183G0002 [uncultured bacterium (gcode 4)]
MAYQDQINIEWLLSYAIKNKASDIHISEGDNVAFRVHWHIWKATQAWIFSREILERLTEQLFRWDTDKIKLFYSKKDADFAYVSSDGTPFRVNGFFKLGKIWFVLRMIERDAKEMDALGLPKWLEKILNAKQGLFLITWPTGSWKSTTMVSILDKINQNRNEHVITIEDPIEFIFSDKQCIFSQREVGRDTDTFISAIRAAMREDPDIVMVWEMRDKETVEAAMNLAETWHLVFSTLHTSWSVQTINRVIQFFNPDIQSQVRVRLADALLWVLSQRLIPKAEWSWRVWIHELMYITSWIKNLIKSGDLIQINNNIEMWSKEWMISMKASADRLRDQWVIKEEDYIWYFTNDD